jgi:broad specificity phosphatase PhoE
MAEALTIDRSETPAPQPGAIILARHGEPAISRAVRLTASEYRQFWSDYEVLGLAPGQTPPGGLIKLAADAGTVVASTRLRSIQSAQAVVRGRAFESEPLYVEAPLPPPPWPGWVRMSPKAWGFIARFWWWFFNHTEGLESRTEAEARASVAAARLESIAASGQDVVVVAHGFFNFMIGRALKRRGWRLAASEGYRYWATRRFERK